ncbi:hypothetical protein GCM10023323_62810 [Streptomyces thinghirensis]|uniref:Uncharacterized protein n=1 Tax=Streptomyces thinghirensis TaxID=551547 RepID=A0ABP9TFS8_9ACTN
MASVGPSAEVQAVTHASAAVTAIEATVRRAVVPVMRPPLVPVCPRARFRAARTLTQRSDTRTGKGNGPRTSEGAGPVNRLGEPWAQTAAGSSSTRRLRVRLESI